MKTSTLLLPILVLFLSEISASDFIEEFKRIEALDNDKKLEAFLEKRKKSEVDNPDYYAIASNYWWCLSESIHIGTMPVEDSTIAVTDPDTGEEVGVT